MPHFSSGERAQLASALANVQSELPIIELDKKVSYKGIFFEYASLSNILHHVRPILSKHGVSIQQHPFTPEAGFIGVETIVMHKSGEWISTSVWARITLVYNAKEDKKYEDPKEVGSLITYLRRYAIGSILGISLDGDYDAHVIAERYEGKPEQKRWLRELLEPMGISLETMGEISNAMKAGNYEMTADSVKDVMESMRK